MYLGSQPAHDGNTVKVNISPSLKHTYAYVHTCTNTQTHKSMICTSQTIKQNFTEGLWREGRKGGLDCASFHQMSLKKYFLKIPFPMTTVHHLFPLLMSKLLSKDFPGGPVPKIPHSQCSGPGFNPQSGSSISYATAKIWCSQINIKNKKTKNCSPTEVNSLSSLHPQLKYSLNKVRARRLAERLESDHQTHPATRALAGKPRPGRGRCGRSSLTVWSLQTHGQPRLRECMHVPFPLPATPFPHCPSDQLFKVSKPRSRTTISETRWEFQTCFLNQRRNGSPGADHSDLALLHDPWVLHLLAHTFALLSHKFLLEVFLSKSQLST